MSELVDKVSRVTSMRRTVTSHIEASRLGFAVVTYDSCGQDKFDVACPFCGDRHRHHEDGLVGGFRLSHCSDDELRDWYFIIAKLTPQCAIINIRGGSYVPQSVGGWHQDENGWHYDAAIGESRR